MIVPRPALWQVILQSKGKARRLGGLKPPKISILHFVPQKLNVGFALRRSIRAQPKGQYTPSSFIVNKIQNHELRSTFTAKTTSFMGCKCNDKSCFNKTNVVHKVTVLAFQNVRQLRRTLATIVAIIWWCPSCQAHADGLPFCTEPYLKYFLYAQPTSQLKHSKNFYVRKRVIVNPTKLLWRWNILAGAQAELMSCSEHMDNNLGQG